MLKGLCAVFCIIIITAGALRAADKKKIAVINFSSYNTPEKYGKIIRNDFEMILYKTGLFEMLEREKIEIVFTEQRIRNPDSIKRDMPVIIGKTLAADFVITGVIEKENGYSLKTRVVRIKDGSIFRAYTRDFKDIQKIRDVVKEISRQIIDDISYYNRYGALRPYEALHTEKKRKTGQKIIIKKKESASSSINLCFAARLTYIYPLGDFSDIVTYGYGLTVATGIDAYHNTHTGLEIGCYSLKGNRGGSEGHLMVPVAAFLIYRFDIYHEYSAYPRISGGMTLITNKNREGAGKTRSDFEPLAQAGMALGYSLAKNCSIKAGAEYGIIFEKKSMMHFVLYNLQITAAF